MANLESLEEVGAQMRSLQGELEEAQAAEALAQEQLKVVEEDAATRKDGLFRAEDELLLAKRRSLEAEQRKREAQRGEKALVRDTEELEVRRGQVEELLRDLQVSGRVVGEVVRAER